MAQRRAVDGFETDRRDPGSLWNGRAFNQFTNSAMAALASARVVKRRFRNRAITQRSANNTPISALALSCGLYERAGIMATP